MSSPVELLRKVVYGSIKALAGLPVVGPRGKNFCQYFIRCYEGYSYDMYENGEYQILKHICRSKTPLVLFDVGANKGDWSQIAHQLSPTARIHCFEPVRETFGMLSAALGSYEGITKNNFGLSNTRSKLQINNYGNGSGTNSLVADPSFKGQAKLKEEVEVRTGKDYIQETGVTHIDFLKIDVEGWEYFVLQGLEEHLDPKIIPVIQFEYGYAHGDMKTLMKDFYALLEGKGYVIGKLRKLGVEFSPYAYHLNNFESGPNFVACAPGHKEQLAKF